MKKTRKQKKAYNLQLRLAAEQRKKADAKTGINQRIPKDLSGPERQAYLDRIVKTKQEPKKNPVNSVEAKMLGLAKRYYESSEVKFNTVKDLEQLSPYQLDKVIGWATWDQDAGKSASRKTEMKMRKNMKFKTKNSYNHSTMRPTA